MEKNYKAGDNVIPPLELEAEDLEDERMLAEARELSLNDVDPERARRRAARGAGSSHGRQRRRHEVDPATSTYLSYRAEELGRSQQPSPFLARRRQVEHQSSLRSLLSSSDVADSHEMEEEIMRQIVDEGLLEGIDLNNLTPAQEEEVTERIAQAFTRRQRERSRRTESRHRRERPSPQVETSSHHRHHSRSGSASMQQTHVHPPVSRPHLLDSANEDSRRQRRERSPSQLSQRSNRSVRREDPASRTSTTGAPSRSATDLLERPQTRDSPRERPRRMSQNDRRVTDPAGRQEQARAYRDRTGSGDRASQRSNGLAVRANDGLAPSQQWLGSGSTEPLRNLRSLDGPSNSSSPALIPPDVSRDDPDDCQRSTTSSAAMPLSSGQQRQPQAGVLLPAAPSISCSRCDKPEIQHSLHYNCFKCDSGAFNLCLSCYRAGKGCMHWFGFGYAATVRFQRADIQGQEPPHILSARQYRRSDRRLEEGLFCEGCFSFANACYWHCDICFDGAWGFCNGCVQTGKHCTHPLVSVTHVSTTGVNNQQQHNSSSRNSSDQDLHPAPLRLQSLSSRTSRPSFDFHIQSPPPSLPHVLDAQNYTFLSIPCSCDVCYYPIPPSHTRFHCPVCSDGDYDICTNCYYSLAATGKLAPENGPQGWRRCLRDHRMAVVGFEDREGGQKRVIVRDMVGGWTLKEGDGEAASTGVDTENGNTRTNGLSGNANAGIHTATKAWRWRESDGSSASHSIGSQPQRMFPPDGGVGLRAVALWSYFPAEGIVDELAFPKWAEIREAEDINCDWFWGVYAGRKGLFPGNYVRKV